MFKRFIALFVIVSFILSYYKPVYAQDFSVNQLPVPGTMVGESAHFTPLALKGLVINTQKPLEFQFIVDTGHGPQDTATVKDQANQLVKYFMAGLTVPEGDLWVNLSPYEKNRMVPEALGQTDLGRDLLAQDYILKQLTASLIYPEKDLGKAFWSKVYSKAQQQFGTTNIPINTFNKVWILPDQAQVFEHGAAAYVTKATLKVMLDEDYLALKKHTVIRNGTDSIGASIVREIVIPEITTEINSGKNFSSLRQIYQALILAKWYKETIQNGLLDAVYTNKNKVAGVNLNDPAIKEKIYNRYLQAYKKGAFNYIKEDSTPDGQVVPRKYFSGGILPMIVNLKRDGAMSAVKVDGRTAVIIEDLAQSRLPKDAAMNVEPIRNASIERIKKNGLEGVDDINDKEKKILRTSWEYALMAITTRYHTKRQLSQIEELVIQAKPTGGNLVDILRDNDKVIFRLDRRLFYSPSYLTGILIQELDRYLSNPQTSLEKVTEDTLLNLDNIIYFLNLSLQAKTDYINFLRNDPQQLKIFLEAVADTPQTQKDICKILKEHYRWTEDNIESLSRLVPLNENVIVNPFVLALTYTKITANTDERKLLENERFSELARLFDKNLEFLLTVLRISNPSLTMQKFYQGLYRVEANQDGVSPSLIILGMINLDPNNNIDKFILSRSRSLPDINTAKVGTVYIGGGGALATAIGRAVTYYNKNIKGLSVPDGYDNVNLVGPFDDGGSSKNDQKAIFDAFHQPIPSPGDISSVMSWQTLTDSDWYDDISNYGIPAFAPELRSPILQLIFLKEKRLKVGSHETLEGIIEDRIKEVVGDPKLMDNKSLPTNWCSLLINLKGVARIIDQNLIATGHMESIRSKEASVQNLIFMAVLIVTRNRQGNFDYPSAMALFHRILGIDRSYAIPSSVENAVLSMTLQDGSVIDREDNIGDLTDKNIQYTAPADVMSFKSQRQDGVLVHLMQSPHAYPAAVNVILNAQNIIYCGMGSAFTSFLPNLMLPGVVSAVAKKKKELPVVYFPKPIFDIETQGLTSYKEIFEVMEKSIRRTTGNNTFTMGEVLTHFVVPQVSQELVQKYYDGLLERIETEGVLTVEALKKVAIFNKEKNHSWEDRLNYLRVIMLDENNYSLETKSKKEAGQFQKAKWIPGTVIPFTDEDQQYFEKRRIVIVRPSSQEQKGMFVFRAGKISYDADTVARFLEKMSSEFHLRYKSLSEETIENPVTVRVAFLRPHDGFQQINDIQIPSFDPDDLWSVTRSANRLLKEIYNRISIYGAIKIEIDASKNLFGEFNRLFNEQQGFSLIGKYSDLVYANGQTSFAITRVLPGSLGQLQSTQRTTVALNKKELQGVRIGLDIGGNQLRAVLVKNGKIIHQESNEWYPEDKKDLEALDGHIELIKNMLYKILRSSSNIITAETPLKSIGVSVNLAVVDNKTTGQGPVMSGLEGEERLGLKDLDKILSNEFNVPVLIVNNGKAAMMESAVDDGFEHTLSLVSDRGVAMGLQEGNFDFLTEGGNIILDVSRNALRHSISGVAGTAQQYLSQQRVVVLAREMGIQMPSFKNDVEAIQYLQNEYKKEGSSEKEKIKDVFKLYSKYLADYIQIISKIVPIRNIVLSGKITEGASGEYILMEAKRLIRERGLEIGLHFPQDPLYKKFGRALGATYYAAYKNDQMPAVGVNSANQAMLNSFAVRMGGFMTLEANVNGVNKALALDYLDNHMDEVLNIIGYVPGDLIDARLTKTIIAADGDGTTYGKPTATADPFLADSVAYDSLLSYLRAGGVYVIISGSDIELTKHRLLATGLNGKSGLPVDVRNRVVIVANGAATMSYINAANNLVEIEDYRQHALAEYHDTTVKNLDLIYVGDDAKPEGNDFPGFKKAGFNRTLTVTMDDNIPVELSGCRLGGLENGVARLLAEVVKQAKDNPKQPLFSNEKIKTLVEVLTNGHQKGYQGSLDNFVNVFPDGGGIQRETLLAKDDVNLLIAQGGGIIRTFLGQLVPYLENREKSPYADIAKEDAVWEQVRLYQNNPENFTNERLLKSSVGTRIEVPGKMPDGRAAQVQIIGVPGDYRKSYLERLREGDRWEKVNHSDWARNSDLGNKKLELINIVDVGNLPGLNRRTSVSLANGNILTVIPGQMTYHTSYDSFSFVLSDATGKEIRSWKNERTGAFSVVPLPNGDFILIETKFNEIAGRVFFHRIHLFSGTKGEQIKTLMLPQEYHANYWYDSSGSLDGRVENVELTSSGDLRVVSWINPNVFSDGTKITSSDIIFPLDLPKDDPPTANDKAALALPPGGIDLNQINVNRTGKTINVQFDPAQLNELEQGNFKGFTPVVTGFRYIQSPFPLLGINTTNQPERLAKV